MPTELPDTASGESLRSPHPASSEPELASLLGALVEWAAQVCQPVDEVGIWLLDGPRGPLHSAVHHPRAREHPEQVVIPCHDTLHLLRVLAGLGALVLDDSVDPRTRELAARCFQAANASVLLAPCRVEGRAVGLLVARRAEHASWDLPAREAAERVARVLGAAVGVRHTARATVPRDGLATAFSNERHSLEQVLQQLPSGVLLSDTHGRIILQNTQSERILGGRVPVDTSVWNVSRAGLEGPEELPLLRALKAGETTRGLEIAFRSPLDGRDVWLSVNTGPVYDDQGEVVAAVAAFQDITERRRTTLALEEEGRLRERFMAILGHDLRTPAAAVLMSAQLLQRSGLEPHQQALVQRVISSGRRMERMIRELLDLGMIRAGRIKLVRGRCDLTAVCEEVVDELRSTWPDRTIDVDLEGPAQGLWDAERLAQVLSNLVGNALAHGSSEHPVRVRLRTHDDHVCLEIRNVGPPIAPELVEHLFRPFHDVRTSRHAGLGLGLFISHAIVSAHGGTIALESHPPTDTGLPGTGLEHPDSQVVVTLRLPLDGAGSPRAR